MRGTLVKRAQESRIHACLVCPWLQVANAFELCIWSRARVHAVRAAGRRSILMLHSSARVEMGPCDMQECVEQQRKLLEAGAWDSASPAGRQLASALQQRVSSWPERSAVLVVRDMLWQSTAYALCDILQCFPVSLGPAMPKMRKATLPCIFR